MTFTRSTPAPIALLVVTHWLPLRLKYFGKDTPPLVVSPSMVIESARSSTSVDKHVDRLWILGVLRANGWR
jgi:hypothetical protein